MTREEMNDIQENASQFILGLFSFSSLALKILSIIDAFKARKKKHDKKDFEMVEEKDN